MNEEKGHLKRDAQRKVLGFRLERKACTELSREGASDLWPKSRTEQELGL